MVLLVTTSCRAKECAAALEQGTRQRICLANTITRALAKLQEAEYEALVIDESLVEIDDRAIDALLRNAGMAMPIYVNLGLHRTERVLRQVQAGLLRKHAERLGAERSAARELQSQLRCDITGILLASELALRESSLPPRVGDRINSVHRLAEQMRSRLEPLSVH